MRLLTRFSLRRVDMDLKYEVLAHTCQQRCGWMLEYCSQHMVCWCVLFVIIIMSMVH